VRAVGPRTARRATRSRRGRAVTVDGRWAPVSHISMTSASTDSPVMSHPREQPVLVGLGHSTAGTCDGAGRHVAARQIRIVRWRRSDGGRVASSERALYSELHGGARQKARAAHAVSASGMPAISSRTRSAALRNAGLPVTSATAAAIDSTV
jgi:hypothetical protein